MRMAALLLAMGMALPVAALAAEAITLDGRVDHPLTLAAADLAAMPQTVVDASFDTAHGKVSGHYSGVLLYALVMKAGIKPDPAKQKHHLQDTILVTGADGYSVAIALAEIDPDFEGKQVIIGTEAAKPGETPRLIVPNDKMGGRAVHDVARIEVQ